MTRKPGMLYAALPPGGGEPPRFLFVSLPKLSDSLRYAEALSAIEDSFADVAPTGWRTVSHGVLDPQDLPAELSGLDWNQALRTRATDIEDFCLPQTGAVNQAAVARLARQLRQNAPHLRPRLTVGAIARGVNFYDREDTLEELAACLANGHVLLTAPRRFGKSSLLYALADQPPGSRRPALADVEDATSPAGFVAKLVVALRKAQWLTDYPDLLAAVGPSRANAEFQETAEDERKLADAHSDDWQSYLSQVFAALSEGQVPALLLIDEFAWVIEHLNQAGDKAQVTALIGALTQIAQTESPYRLLIAGSANLRSLLRETPEDAVAAFFTAFRRFALPPMSPEAGRELVRMVLAENGLYPPGEILDAILECIGTPIPYFLQLFASRLVQRAPASGELTEEEVKRVYQHDLLGPESKRFFEHYTRAANQYRADWQTPARRVLARLTRGPAPPDALTAVIRETLPAATDADAEQILAFLEEDLYLGKNAQGEYDFTSKVLSDWWQRHGPSGVSG